MRRDRGFVLVLSALLLVVLLLFGSFAVDLGGVYNARRQDQSAADSAALAAVQDVTDTTLLVEQARNRAADTLGVDPASLDFDSCVAGDLPPGFTGVTGANCIGLDNTGVRVAVRVPTRQYTTAFARLVGLDTFDHSAFAVAGQGREGFGGVLPFALFSGVGTGFGCIRQGTGKLPAKLDGFCKGSGDITSGNFGTVDFGSYLDPSLGCSGSEFGARLANNVAVGVDHRLELWDGVSASERPDTYKTSSACPTYAQGLFPNSLLIDSGNNDAMKGAADGLFGDVTFNDGQGARLTRSLASEPDWMQSGGAHRTHTIGGATVDDIPLWEFIPDHEVADIPLSCQRTQFTGTDGIFGTSDDLLSLPAELRTYFSTITDPNLRVLALFDRCFTHHLGSAWSGFSDEQSINEPELPACPGGGTSGCSGMVFSRRSTTGPLWDIQYSPRFGYVPQLYEDGGNPSSYYHIQRFQPIFIQGTYAGCSSGKDSCELEAAPQIYGGSSPASNQTKLDGLTAVVFPPGTLPPGLGGPEAPFEFGVNLFAQLVR